VRTSQRLALHSLFFVSGAAALAYEVLWMRQFSVFLGATAPAAAAALTAFFVGLGAGSYLLGRAAPRLGRPLLMFATLELVTGVSALSVGPVLNAMQPVLGWLYDGSGANPALQLCLRVGVAVIAVLIPATCMGGTMPVLAQVTAARADSLGVRAGGLYAVNTLGAALGSLMVPAILLPTVGVNGALAVVVAVSLFVAAAALMLARWSDTRASKPSPANPTRGARTSRSESARPVPRGTLAFAAISGVITLGLEALATRAFALVHENSVYSFATVVSIFLAGLGIGAAIARVALRRGVNARRLLSSGWAAAGVWMIGLPAIFVRTTGLEYLGGGRLSAHEASLAGLVAVVVLPPSLLLGLALPALMEERGIGREGGPAVGSILAANTAGAIVGPMLAMFGLVPAIGLWQAVSVLGALTIIVSAIAAAGAPRSTRRTVVAAVVASVVVFLVNPPGSLPRVTLSTSDRLLDLREGALGSVAVVEHDGQRRLKLNNFYVLGGTSAGGDERLQGHIPLLLHPRPERVAFLGLGTGISLSAVHFHPVREAVALELVPEVVAAARDWFGDANLHVLGDPRVRVRAEDARSYVAATRDRFDVVVGDLVVPWRAGESALYTRDSFEAVRRVLAPRGLYCQWVPLYQLSEPEFDSIAASFLDVFPRTTLWLGDFNAGDPVVGLVGHTDPQGLDPALVDARASALAADRDPDNPYLAHAAGLWMHFVGPLDGSEQPFRMAPRNLDASPLVELMGPRLQLEINGGDAAAFHGRSLQDRLQRIRAHPLPGTAAASLDAAHLAWRDRGADIWEASLRSFEGDNEAADRLGMATLARLPIEVQYAVLGRAVITK
jgi:spermidine synthase